MNNKVLVEIIKPEAMEWLELMGKQGLVRLLDDKSSEPKSDDEIAEAVEQMLGEFAVKAQWVAIYRVLVDFYGFPSGYRDFSKRIGRMMPRYGGRLACDEQTIQKGIMAHPVLTKHYEKWLAYEPKDGERSVARQKHTAMRFLRLLDDRTLR